jgi:hypothetical protein
MMKDKFIRFYKTKKNPGVLGFLRFGNKNLKERRKLMKKAMMLFLAAMFALGAITLVSTEAKAAREDCECWEAWWTEGDPGTVNYNLCLEPPGEEATNRDYKFWFVHPDTEVTQYVWLDPAVLQSCAEPCVKYTGEFRSSFNPISVLVWWVTYSDNVPIDELDQEHLRNCNDL